MVRLLLASLACCAALAAPVSGRITDGAAGLPGVRVYPDRLARVRSRDLPPVALTDADGRFTLDLDPADTVLAVEKSGWRRDLVPLAEFAAPVALRPAAGHHSEKVLAVRLDLPGMTQLRSDDELRAILFSRRPGEASAANYYYEISKGCLELEEGALIHLALPDPPRPLDDRMRVPLIKRVLERLRAQLGDAGLAAFDQVDNGTGALKPDGKPDHLWIIPPGPSRTVTLDPAHFSAITYMMPLPWNAKALWPTVFFSEETPLGNIVHEGVHAMGEQRVGDLYMDGAHPLTAGRWDLMDAGEFQGWDREHTTGFPWQEDSGYSPAHPTAWVRADLWYRGRYRDLVPAVRAEGDWEGWLDPVERAPGDRPQQLVVPDPRGRGRFWSLEVRRPWGFDRGRTGDRWGAGFEGLVVAAVDPARNKPGSFLGPVRVVNAHPGSPEPPMPRYPGGRWQLDGAAFNVGTGENPAGGSGPLTWEVLAADASGALRVRARLSHAGAKSRPRKHM
jgi:hypothetical protein